MSVKNHNKNKQLNSPKNNIFSKDTVQNNLYRDHENENTKNSPTNVKYLSPNVNWMQKNY